MKEGTEMYISRVEMSWDSVKNPYEYHRRLWRLFPGEMREPRRAGEGERQGFLFRVEESRTGRMARFLVQSRRPPEQITGLTLLGYREFHPQPDAGQRLAFLLTANPVKTINDTARETKLNKKSEKCRVPLLREEERREWLTRKLADAVMVEAVSVLPHAPFYFRKGGQGGKLVPVSFEGVLRVLNGPALVRALENGIGPAKAFGCGLMLVRRI
jgi:CRISPR system Cascade subunit CasE